MKVRISARDNSAKWHGDGFSHWVDCYTSPSGTLALSANSTVQGFYRIQSQQHMTTSTTSTSSTTSQGVARKEQKCRSNCKLLNTIPGALAGVTEREAEDPFVVAASHLGARRPEYVKFLKSWSLFYDRFADKTLVGVAAKQRRWCLGI